MKSNKEKGTSGKKEKNSETPPDVMVFRIPKDAQDVKLLLANAKKAGFASTWGLIFIRALRHRLTPEFGSKKIHNIQRSLGLP